ncbi:uncharacterized protein MELLADRAFT_87523 [Melampsora larici-populina 98AG31]|uniref:Alpha-type protein kinase domain-containing protein n=1 Tax=Melampsora larici-populina (strain 98AG31 / pathotype 3-4-7) TaxID=747676 RepID=F4RNM8_MELLP|nr:uncharacterized protein MELLADRAFT_87523 [Melampsora larici-populina 98AG31]EGG06010.1 hypothetical protein MELLADRAFT_87523 [Melampsora larici-populina 98AG31]
MNFPLDWFDNLAYEVYTYYQQEASLSAFPNKAQIVSGILPLPNDFSANYCIMAENNVAISKETIEAKLIQYQKKKRLDKSKFGLIFNMKRYDASRPKLSSSPEAPSCKKRKRKKSKYSSSSDDSDKEDDESLQGFDKDDSLEQFQGFDKDDSLEQLPALIEAQFQSNQEIIDCNNQEDLDKDNDVPLANQNFLELDNQKHHEEEVDQLDVQLNDKLDGSTKAHEDDNNKSGLLGDDSSHHPLNIHEVSAGQLSIDESMSLKSFGDTRVLATTDKRILPYPVRPISNWTKGWILSLITKDKEPLFKPIPVSYRVDRSSCIGSGLHMDCYRAELLLDDKVHHVVAKQTSIPTSLSYYQCQAQAYVHAEAAIERFKTKVLGINKFSHVKKELVQSLRMVKRWVVQPVGTKGRSFICDLQGVGTTLTDPVFNDLDKNFGSGNLNYEGLKLLISQHKENMWCKKMGLGLISEWKHNLNV